MSWVALDTETTGLDPRVHVPWEVAVVEADGSAHRWAWRPHEQFVASAEAVALEVGGFHDRAPSAYDPQAEGLAARQVAELLDGRIIVGSKPSFDVEMLTPWLRSWGVDPTWHHRPVCVATVAYGWLHRHNRLDHTSDVDLTLPWRSDDLAAACGVEPPGEGERHTALGDARWVARWYRQLTGGAS